MINNLFGVRGGDMPAHRDVTPSYGLCMWCCGRDNFFGFSALIAYVAVWLHVI